MISLEVGKVIDNYIGHEEGVYFDFDASGAVLTVFFNTPSQFEIAQFHEMAQFEMRLADIDGLMIFTVKIGALNWMDAPYTPHLSKNLTVLEDIPDGLGYTMTLVLIDAGTGKIEHLRLISMSTNFSREIKRSIENDLTTPFDKMEYNKILRKVFATYSTEQLVSMTNIYFRMN